MSDGMTDYLVMTRGGNLVATSIIPDFQKSVFKSFSFEGHIATLKTMITEQPKDLKLIQDFRDSLLKLGPLCQKLHEKNYYDAMLRCITAVPTSSFAGM